MKENGVSRKKTVFMYAAVAVSVFAVFVLALATNNPYMDNPGDFLRMMSNEIFGSDYELGRNVVSIFKSMKLPGTILGFLAGGSLAVAGLVYQEIFKSRLASPGMLGVSGGANLGGSIAILLGLSGWMIVGFGFFLGGIALIMTVVISRRGRLSENPKLSLILSGLLTGVFFMSLTGIVVSVAKGSMFDGWYEGRLFGAIIFRPFEYMGCFMLISIITFMIMTWAGTICRLFGWKERAYRAILIAGATLLASTAAAFFGNLAWIGLAVPVAVKRFTGDSRTGGYMAAFLLGGAWLVLPKTICGFFADYSIGISMVTGVTGVIIMVLGCIGGKGNAWDYHT